MSGEQEAGGSNWRINEVSTEIIITESVGSLGPEEVRKLVNLVMEHVRHEQQTIKERGRDTAVKDRAYESDVR